MDFIKKAQQDYKEFCELFDGRNWNEVENIVKENKLFYCAEKPSCGNGLADINYKNILATIRNEDGVVRVNLLCEVYDNKGSLLSVQDL